MGRIKFLMLQYSKKLFYAGWIRSEATIHHQIAAPFFNVKNLYGEKVPMHCGGLSLRSESALQGYIFTPFDTRPLSKIQTEH